MERNARYFLVGLLLLVSAVGLIIAVVWMANTPDTKSRKIYQVTFHQSIAGLGIGSRVSYLGVPVGEVTQLKLAETGSVAVEIAIDPQTPVNQETVAALSTSGLTGQSTIELEQASATRLGDSQRNAEPLPENWTIPGKASVINTLSRSAPIIANRADEALMRMSLLLSDENLENTSAMLVNLKNAAQQMEIAAQDMQKMMRDISDTNRAVQTLVPNYNAVADQLNREVLPGFQVTSQELNATSKLIARQMTQNSKVFREFIAESRLSMQVVRDQILVTARKAEEFTDELRANPSRLIYKQRENGLEFED